MKRLLIVTDHRFYRYGDQIFDDYVFDYPFFQDYLESFHEVRVLARVIARNEVHNTEGLRLSSGPNLTFIDFPDLRRHQLLLNVSTYIRQYDEQLLNCSAICFRIPSLLSYSVFSRIQKLNHDVPLMFELIGDPEEGFGKSSTPIIGKLLSDSFARYSSKRVLKIVSNATCGSYVSKNHLQKNYPIAKNARAFSISSIRLYPEDFIEGPRSYNLDNELRIVTVGSLIPVKNQAILIRILDKLKKTGHNASLTIVGSGNQFEALSKLAEDLNVSSSVLFTGQLSTKASVQKVLDSNDIFILPSLSEGMPRALIEAMSRKLICLGADRGGISELLDPKFLFSEMNPSAIATQIIDLISNFELIVQSIASNFETAKSFEYSKLKGKRSELLQTLLKATK